MPGQFRALCHGFTHWASPTIFCHLQYQHNRVQSAARYGFGNLPVLNVVIDWADRNHHANIRRAGGNQIFQNSAAKHRIPSA